MNNGIGDLRCTEIQAGGPPADNVQPWETCGNGTTSPWFWRAGDMPLGPHLLFYTRIQPALHSGGCHLLNLAPERSGALPVASLQLAEQIGALRDRAGRLVPTERIHVRKDAWQFTGSWEQARDQHGTSRWVNEIGAMATVPFAGRGFRLIGRRKGRGAVVNLDLDGRRLVAGLDLSTDLGLELPRQVLCCCTDLADGYHELKITVAGSGRFAGSAQELWLDAIETGPVSFSRTPSHLINSASQSRGSIP